MKILGTMEKVRSEKCSSVVFILRSPLFDSLNLMGYLDDEDDRLSHDIRKLGTWLVCSKGLFD